MKLVHEPDDADREEYIVKPDQFFHFDSEPIEEVGGPVWSNWVEFLHAVDARKTRALRALLWHERKKKRPETTFAEVVVHPGKIWWEYDEDEIARAREMAASEDTPDEIREAIVAAFGELGKDEPSETSDTPTDGESPESSDAT